MKLLDFLKDKFGSGGSGGSGTVTTAREDAEAAWVEAKEIYGESNTDGQKENLEGAIIQTEVDVTKKMPEIKAGGVIRTGDIINFNYVGINGKAEMAKQLRDNPLLSAILDELKEFNLVQLLNTKEGEKESREDLYRKLRTIEDIKGKIEKYIKNAESVKKREEARKDNYGVV